ncbi:hypothetical protein NC652_034095 [Populus alba x Populus x berolinensis]|nr:hypothetical protein NC652_034095 [Populus alba x Populus x berolinensis]
MERKRSGKIRRRPARGESERERLRFRFSVWLSWGRWLCFFGFGQGRESLWAARRGRGQLRLSWSGLCGNGAACGAGETMES